MNKLIKTISVPTESTDTPFLDPKYYTVSCEAVPLKGREVTELLGNVYYSFGQSILVKVGGTTGSRQGWLNQGDAPGTST